MSVRLKGRRSAGILRILGRPTALVTATSLTGPTLVSMDRIVYASFDRFPAPKGAAVHIEAFARALGAAFGGVYLVTVAPVEAAVPVAIPFVTHHPLPALGADPIERVSELPRPPGGLVAGPSGGRRPRPIDFEGYPVARRKGAFCDRLVFEVNGLPSVELKYHYPAVADDRELLRKLRAMEDACLAAADLVVTVSRVTADYLAGRGVGPAGSGSSPTASDPDVFTSRPSRAPGDGPVRLLYAGTMSPWQGVRLAIEALALLRRDMPATLTLAGPSRPRQARELRELCWHLGVADAVQFTGPVDQPHAGAASPREPTSSSPL